MVSALGTNDERIIEEFKDISQGKNKDTEKIFIMSDIPESIKIKYKDFESSIKLQIWDRLNTGWSIGFKYLQKYFEREGHSNVPHRYQTDDGYPLGTWVNTQRTQSNQNKLSKERLEKLKTVNFSFNILEDKWNIGFKYLQDYFDREGHSNVARVYKTNDGYPLGNWVGVQCMENNKNKLSKERLEKLKTVNFSFNILEDLWDEGFKYLQDYFNREGHSNVNSRYQTDDGYALGSWVANQRTYGNQNKLSKERLEKLKTVNFSFNILEDLWDEGFKYLQDYFNREGHSKVVKGYKTNDGYPLGNWVVHQRTYGNQNKLSNEQLERLQSVNFSFNPHQDQWDEGFKYLQDYFNREGHSNVHSRYQTDDGYALGEWVTSQRKCSKQNKLSKERLEKLKTVNFKLIVRGVKSN